MTFSPGLALASQALERSDSARQASAAAAADDPQIVLQLDDDSRCLVVEAAVPIGSSPVCPVSEHAARPRHGSVLRARASRVCILRKVLTSLWKKWLAACEPAQFAQRADKSRKMVLVALGRTRRDNKKLLLRKMEFHNSNVALVGGSASRSIKTGEAKCSTLAGLSIHPAACLLVVFGDVVKTCTGEPSSPRAR